MTEAVETATEDTAADKEPDFTEMSDEEETEFLRKAALRGKAKAEAEEAPQADEGKGSAADKDGGEPEEKKKEPEKKGKSDDAKDSDKEKVDDSKSKSKSVDDKKADQDSDKDAKDSDGKEDGDDEKPDVSKPPQNISKAVKEAWEKIPEDARAEIAKSHSESNIAKMQLGREQAKVKAAAEKAAPAVAFLKEVAENTPGVKEFLEENGAEGLAEVVSSALRMDTEYAKDPIKVVFTLAQAAGVLGDFKEALADLDVKPSGKQTNLGRDDGDAGQDPRDAKISRLEKQVKDLQGRDYKAESDVARHKSAYQKALDHAEANSPIQWDAETRQAVTDNLVKAAKADPSASEAEHVRRAINAVAEYHPTLERIASPSDADAAGKAAKAANAAGTNVNPAGGSPAAKKDEAEYNEDDVIRGIVKKHYPGWKPSF